MWTTTDCRSGGQAAPFSTSTRSTSFAKLEEGAYTWKDGAAIPNKYIAKGHERSCRLRLPQSRAGLVWCYSNAKIHIHIYIDVDRHGDTPHT